MNRKWKCSERNLEESWRVLAFRFKLLARFYRFGEGHLTGTGRALRTESGLLWIQTSRLLFVNNKLLRASNQPINRPPMMSQVIVAVDTCEVPNIAGPRQGNIGAFGESSLSRSQPSLNSDYQTDSESPQLNWSVFVRRVSPKPSKKFF